MSLKLMYITNRPDVMKVAEENGVDRIFIDMETFGKEERQHNIDTVKSFHTVNDVANARKVLKKAEILVRVNSICDESESEINSVIEAGADIIMLPYFSRPEQVQRFIELVGGRVRTCLLFETNGSVDAVDEIISIPGINEIHIGINDMHLCYKKKFMFELLSDGTVEYLCEKFRNKNIPYGFGGIARLGCGEVPAEMIIAEHYRLGSSMAILSRQFCKNKPETDILEIKDKFKKGVEDLRKFEDFVSAQGEVFFENNRIALKKAVEEVVEKRIKSGY